MKAYVPDIIILALGVLVMALLLLLGALSRSWVALLCFLGTAVVYHTWFRHLIQFIARASGVETEMDDEDDDNEDIFPSA
jgi:hypothetical protein